MVLRLIVLSPKCWISECERDGQSEAIATNLCVMAGLTVPIVTILVGEGGSGGALGIGMGNRIGVSPPFGLLMLSAQPLACIVVDVVGGIFRGYFPGRRSVYFGQVGIVGV